MYRLLRKFLFTLNPETSHYVALKSLKIAYQLNLVSFLYKQISAPKKVMGLTFPNPIGLAAGLDKNGEYIDALASLGFGFIEIGTVTPKPQPGNPKPRLFRLIEQKAIINRMGFNGKGVDYVIEQLEKTQYRGILGINIGKNKDTPNENAIDDYLFCFRKLHKYASYITINISSPNTVGLRDLQHKDALSALLTSMKQEQHLIHQQTQRYIPLVVKISPDLSEIEIKEIAHILLTEKIDGVIATNTTLSRNGAEKSKFAKENGGLSGEPLQELSNTTIAQLHSILQNQIPIIGVGGIVGKQSAEEKIKSGAALLQIYSGFIYEGPALINELNINVIYRT